MTRYFAALALAAGVTLATSPMSAQSLGIQVDRVRDGDVRFSFPLRPDVCGSGQSVSWNNGQHRQTNVSARTSRDVEYEVDCESGPGRVVVARRDGEVAQLRFYVGGRWRPAPDATDLGMVSTRAASEYLGNLAGTSDGNAGRQAIMPLTLVDSVTVWPTLMRIARDDHRPRETRKDAVFWLGQLAEEPATRGLNELVGESDVGREVRKQAIFALSQRPDREGVPALISVVRNNPDPELRRQALFWLAQTNDPRALDLIEELLRK